MVKNKRTLEKIISDWQIKCKENEELQSAIKKYLTEHDLVLPDGFTYSFGIDYTSIRVDGFDVLIVGQPPTSNYEIEETEHTYKYLLPRLKAAV